MSKIKKYKVTALRSKTIFEECEFTVDVICDELENEDYDDMAMELAKEKLEWRDGGGWDGDLDWEENGDEEYNHHEDPEILNIEKNE